MRGSQFHQGLPKTGQDIEYRVGDNGTFRAGLPASGARFIDNGNGTIFDTVTRLVWVKQPELIIPGAPLAGIPSNQIQVAGGNWANDTEMGLAEVRKDTDDSTYWVCCVAHTSAAQGTFADDRTANPTYWRQTVWSVSADDLVTPDAMTWNSFIDNCLGVDYGGTLLYAGYGDWRPPNIKELVSILDYGRDNPAVDETFFPNTQCGDVGPLYESYYWSSTTKLSLPDTHAWAGDFYEGYVVTDTTHCQLYVRPVRGGIHL